MIDSMVKWTAVLWIAGAGMVSAAEGSPKPETVVRWQFAGAETLQSRKDVPKNFRELLAMPQTTALRDAALNRWARLAGTRTAHGGPNAEALTGFIRPLLLDAVQQESRLEVSKTGESADWALAVRVPADRIALWSTNLWQWAQGARVGQPAAAKGGWTCASDRYSVAFTTDKDWVVVHGGASPLDRQTRLFGSFRKSLRKKHTGVLKAEANLVALRQLGKEGAAAAGGHAPKLTVNVVPTKEGLRSELLLDYPEDLQIRPERWDIPLETIREPLIGFTAIQGIERFLAKHPTVASAGFEKIPNQAFLWSQGISLFTVNLAAKVGNPAPVMDRIAQGMAGGKAPALIGASGGQLLYVTNDHRLVWRGLPIVVPFLGPARAPDHQFLVAGLFPTSNRETNGMPAELLKQVNRPGLVYYDWEITQARLTQWRPIWQLTRIARSLLLADNSPSEAWLEAIGPKLGNTITEATLQKKNQLKVVRRSDAGLSALELTLLAHWLDGSNDPKLPARQPRSDAPRKAPGPRPAAKPPAR